MDKLIIIGERINTSRKSIELAVTNKDEEFILEEANRQIFCGANILDINCSSLASKEIDGLLWCLDVLTKKLDVSFCIDTADPGIIKKVISEKGDCISFINSITAQSERYETVLPLVKEFDKSVIALTMDSKGLPANSDDRLKIAEKIYKIVEQMDVDINKVYLDPLVRPLSTEPEQAKEFIKSLSMIKEKFNFKLSAGISNVSFGLPKRNIINAFFLSIAVFNGLDLAILDPCQSLIIPAVKSSYAISNKDQFCSEYIKAWREKKI